MKIILCRPQNKLARKSDCLNLFHTVVGKKNDKRHLRLLDFHILAEARGARRPTFLATSKHAYRYTIYVPYTLYVQTVYVLHGCACTCTYMYMLD